MKKLGIFLVTIILAGSLTACQNATKEGLARLQDKQYDQAVTAFEKAIDKQQNLGEAYRGLGLARWQQQDYKAAAKALKQALDNGAKPTATIYNLIGISEMKEKVYDSALNYFRLGLAQGDAGQELRQQMRRNMIYLYEEKGDYESARSLLTEYVADYPKDEAARRELDFLQTR